MIEYKRVIQSAVFINYYYFIYNLLCISLFLYYIINQLCIHSVLKRFVAADNQPSLRPSYSVKIYFLAQWEKSRKTSKR